MQKQGRLGAAAAAAAASSSSSSSSSSSFSSSSSSSSSSSAAPPPYAHLSSADLLSACSTASGASVALGDERFLLPAAWWRSFEEGAATGGEEATGAGVGGAVAAKPGALDPGHDLGDKVHKQIVCATHVSVSPTSAARRVPRSSRTRARARSGCARAPPPLPRVGPLQPQLRPLSAR